MLRIALFLLIATAAAATGPYAPCYGHNVACRIATTDIIVSAFIFGPETPYDVPVGTPPGVRICPASSGATGAFNLNAYNVSCATVSPYTYTCQNYATGLAVPIAGPGHTLYNVTPPGVSSAIIGCGEFSEAGTSAVPTTTTSTSALPSTTTSSAEPMCSAAGRAEAWLA